MIETKEYRPPAQNNSAPRNACVETVEYNPVQQAFFSLPSVSPENTDRRMDASSANASNVENAVSHMDTSSADVRKPEHTDRHMDASSADASNAENAVSRMDTSSANVRKPEHMSRKLQTQSIRGGIASYAQRFERLKRLADEVAGEIPEEMLKHLHGGISMSDGSKLHKGSDPHKPLYILGEYCNSSSIGRHIILYGGSIDRVYGAFSDDALKKELERIIKHELTHHWESLSGTRDLEIYDAEMLEKYKDGLNKDTETE